MSPQAKSKKKKISRAEDKLLFYPKQNYSCLNCTRCCTRWDVPIKKEEKLKIEKLDIPGFDFKSNSSRYFEPYGRKNIYLIKKIQNKCIFLGNDNLCIIHKHHGEPAKPLACRLYPFDIFCWEDGMNSVTLRHDCPAVAYSKGKAITMHKNSMLKLAEEIGRASTKATAVYCSYLPATLEKVRHINNGYRKILLAKHIDLKLRLYGAARLLEFHDSQENHSDILEADSSFADDAFRFFTRSLDDLEAVIMTAAEPNVNQRVILRYLMSGFARIDEEAKNGFLFTGRISRTAKIIKFILGRGNLADIGSSYPDTTGIDPIEVLKETVFTPKSLEPYYHFIAAKLHAMNFCGNPTLKFSFQHGMRHLLLVLPIACAFAALYAKRFGKTSPDQYDIGQALMIIDHTFSRSPFFKMRHIRNMTNKLCSTYEFPAILSLINQNNSD